MDFEGKTLLLVAGPSGAGKTVFINQFRKGTLAPELRQLLPANAERWPQIGANDCMKRGVGIAGVLPEPWTAAGGVAHYDTAYIHRFGLDGYEHDPIAELFETVGRLIVISIMPDAAALTAQFDQRITRLNSRKKPSHLLWKQYVRRPLLRLLGDIKGGAPRGTRELYEDPAWIERCHEAWVAYAERLIDSKPGSSHVALEPAVGAEGEETFRPIPEK